VSIVAFVFIILICWSIFPFSTSPDPLNDPPVFRGQRGKWLAFALMTVTTISIGSALIWTFLTIWWPLAIVVIFLGGYVGSWSYGKLPLILNGSAIGSFVWAIALVAINVTAWGMLRP
jgi:hypothetical protein